MSLIDKAFASERSTATRTNHFIIYGDPIPLQRPRMSGTHCWDSQKQQKMIISRSFTTQLADGPLFQGPLSVEFLFYFPLKKRMTPKKKLEMTGTAHIFKPDLDNLIKMYLDCSSDSILFKDDATVAQISAKKLYGDPRTEMIITELL